MENCSCHHHTNDNHKHTHASSCHCSHNHKNNKKTIIRLIIGALIIIGNIFINFTPLYLLAFLIFSYDIIIESVKDLFKKRIFSENLLMSIASLGALLLGEYIEGCAIMFFFNIGELFSHLAEKKSEKSIRDLIDIKPEYANLLVDNTIKKINPTKLKIGDIVIVSVGEKIPADAVVTEGKSQLDTSSLTGEENYQYVSVNDCVLGGTINCGNVIKIKITSTFENSNISKVLKLFNEIENNKSSSEKFITKFAKVYTPIVCAIALIILLIPLFYESYSFFDAFYQALTVLVVSCPCALVISVPLCFFLSCANASKNSVLIKGSLAIEKLSKIKTIAFDKTGTLTNSKKEILSLHCVGEKAKVLEYISYAEFYSTHPISQVVLDEYNKLFKKEINPQRILDYTEIAGKGICAKLDNHTVLLGNSALMEENNIEYKKPISKNTIIYISIDNKFTGYLEFVQGINKSAKETIDYFKSKKINTIILSGDNKESVLKIADTLGIKTCHHSLLPHQKIDVLNKYKSNENICFVGDGINDTPVLSVADVGISMGLEGSDASIEASDIVLLSNDLSKISDTHKLSKKTMQIVWENIIYSIAIKALVMILALFGYSNLWLAVFADVGTTFFAIINSLRALKIH